MISLVAGPAWNGVASLVLTSASMASLASYLEHNGRDVVVVGIGPVRLDHEAVIAPVLVGFEPRIIHPLWVDGQLASLVVWCKSLVILAEALVVSPGVVLVLPPLVVGLVVSPCIWWGLILAPLVGLVGLVGIITPLVVLVLPPLIVRLIAVVSPSIVLILIASPLVVGRVVPPLIVGLVVSPLSLITLALVRIESLALVGIIEPLSLISPHCKSIDILQ